MCLANAGFRFLPGKSFKSLTYEKYEMLSMRLWEFPTGKSLIFAETNQIKDSLVDLSCQFNVLINEFQVIALRGLVDRDSIETLGQRSNVQNQTLVTTQNIQVKVV